MCRVSGALNHGACADDYEDIANYIYEHTTRATLDLDLQGIWINDREPPFDARLLLVPLIHNYFIP